MKRKAARAHLASQIVQIRKAKKSQRFLEKQQLDGEMFAFSSGFLHLFAAPTIVWNPLGK